MVSQKLKARKCINNDLSVSTDIVLYHTDTLISSYTASNECKIVLSSRVANSPLCRRCRCFGRSVHAE
jgi:hypothetical protein